MRKDQALLSIGMAAALLSACTYQKVLYDPWAQYRDMADKTNPERSRGAQAAHAFEDGWGILLECFEGDRRAERASRLVKRLRDEARLSDVWIKEMPDKVLVFRGHFSDQTSPEAKTALQETRTAQLDGVRPYESAGFVSLAATARQATGNLDLRQFVGQGLYSLQVAAFDEIYDKDFRKSAESYAAELRAKGDEAYFYHGANLSIVTVGLFSDDDFEEVDVQQQSPTGISKYKQKVYGPKMLKLQEKYPHNIYDGYTIKEKNPDGTSVEQSSFLVPIQ